MNNKLAQFTEYEKDNMNGPTAIKEIEFISYKSSKKNKLVLLENYNRYLRKIFFNPHPRSEYFFFIDF